MEAKLSNWKMIQVKKKHSIKTFVKRKKKQKKTASPYLLREAVFFVFETIKKTIQLRREKEDRHQKKRK